MREVELSWAEAAAVGTIGLHHHLRALYRKAEDRYGYRENDPLGTTVESCGAEYAVGKLLNRHWNGFVSYGNDLADVGADLQVRWTHRANGRLRVEPGDDPDQRYVLVTGVLPVYSVVGWLFGREAKTEASWQSLSPGRFSHWHGQDSLTPIEMIEELSP